MTNSFSNSLPSEAIFSMPSSSLMLVNLTITSTDVYRVNKRGNYFLYFLHALFWKWLFSTFSWSLHLLRVVRRWCSFPFRLSLGYFWTHRKLFVTFSMFPWIKAWWYRFALLFICVFYTKLAFSFFILI